MGTYLIAKREYLQIVKSVGFLVFVLCLPVLGAIGFILPRILERTEPTRYVVIVDQTGDYQASIKQTFDNAQRRRIVSAWDMWARIALLPEAYDDRTIEPVFLPNITSFAARSGDDIAAFEDAGGIAAAQKAVAPYIRQGIPVFEIPRERIKIIDMPKTFDQDDTLAEIGQALVPYMMGEKAISYQGQPRRLFAAVLIKDKLDRAIGDADDITPPQVHYWSTNLAILNINTQVENAILRALKYRAYQKKGVPIEIVAQVNALSLSIKNFQPEQDGTDAAVEANDLLERFLPVIFAYFLFLSVFGIGNRLLTSVIEEKSNKIVEVLLSSVTAHQMMAGKLIGLGAVSLTAMSAWALMGLALILGVMGDASLFISVRDILMANGLLPWFLLFFILGYFMFCSIFLAVGSLCQSIQDAQSYLVPISMILIMPMSMAFFIIRDPSGIVARIMTWIPLYSPYALLLRISSNMPPWELYGATAMLALTTIGMVWLMGRVFHQSILNAGQPPKWREVFRLLRG